MKTTMLNKVIFFILITLTLTACGGGGGGGSGSSAQPEGPRDPQAEEEAAEDGVITFAELSQTILSPKCIRCHREFNSEEGVRGRIVPGDPEGSLLFQMVESGEMPRTGTPLDTRQLEIVRTYIEGVAISSHE